MNRVLPFAGLRFQVRVVGDLGAVVCPPYDVISAEEQRQLQAASPYNAVHVELPSDPPGRQGGRYEHAAELLRHWRQARALCPDARPAYYLHETRFTVRGERRMRRDLIAALGVEPWEAGTVVPHEHTFAGPKADRLALMAATHANVSPVWVLSRGVPAPLAEAWAAAEQRAPDTWFSLGDEEHHLWVVDDPGATGAIQRGFAESGPLYVADGHHRYETALAFKGGAGRALPGADATLAVITSADDPGLVILPTHRLVRALPDGLAMEELEARWSPSLHLQYFPVWDAPPLEQLDALRAQLEARGELGPAFGVYGPAPDLFALLELRGRTPPTEALPADRSDAWKSLDVSLLHALVIEPLVEELGRPREQVLGYTRSFHGAFDAVRAGAARLALFLNPTRVSQVLAVADAGDRLPEKSTYFYPKPPTGLVIRDLAQG